ncbi:MAG: EamA family transporter RarD, partial [Moraxellaceae bacterium]|nr:EamA family transporter RarD [Moraxellaceae bacterium]
MSSKQTIKISNTPIETSTQGVLTSLSAFAIWGMFPLYFKQLSQYNPIEIIIHRIVWTFLLLLLLVVATRRFAWIHLFKEQPKWLLFTFFSGLIITSNWLTYVWAVNNEQILEASLGYFMSPLIGVALSLIVLQEKLRKLQWVAIAIATIAVAIQMILLGKLPWVSLVLALSFGFYGIMQRKTPLMTIDGLFIETALVVPFALYWLSVNQVQSSELTFWFSSKIWLLMLAGPITLTPLLLFNKSTKMVAYSILSFMNYLTPTFVFLLAVFYYHEPFDNN